MWNNKSYMVCNNCGKCGHIFNECRDPITSHGVILYRETPDMQKRQYLMIRRKDSFGYIDFMRGKYHLNNSTQIQNLLNEMTMKEKSWLITQDFSSLWNELWIYSPNKQHFMGEENKAKSKYESIQPNLQEMLAKSDTMWVETEWEFPKGKRNSNEKEMDCALREFEEETGISCKQIDLFDNVLPFEENFIGSNGKTYKNKYYLAKSLLPYEVESLVKGFQPSEVSKMQWKTYEECMGSIRNYHFEKKQLLCYVDELLSTADLQVTPHYPFYFDPPTTTGGFDTFVRGEKIKEG